MRSSNATLGAFADEDQNISSLVSKLPGTLDQTATTLGKVDRLADQMGPTFESLRAPFSKLDDANAAVLPFVEEAAPILQKQVRPFARARSRSSATSARRRPTSPRRTPTSPPRSAA